MVKSATASRKRPVIASRHSGDHGLIWPISWRPARCLRARRGFERPTHPTPPPGLQERVNLARRTGFGYEIEHAQGAAAQLVPAFKRLAVGPYEALGGEFGKQSAMVSGSPCRFHIVPVGV